LVENIFLLDPARKPAFVDAQQVSIAQGNVALTGESTPNRNGRLPTRRGKPSKGCCKIHLPFWQPEE
jgi:hypothetical protein